MMDSEIEVAAVTIRPAFGPKKYDVPDLSLTCQHSHEALLLVDALGLAESKLDCDLTWSRFCRVYGENDIVARRAWIKRRSELRIF